MPFLIVFGKRRPLWQFVRPPLKFEPAAKQSGSFPVFVCRPFCALELQTSNSISAAVCQQRFSHFWQSFEKDWKQSIYTSLFDDKKKIIHFYHWVFSSIKLKLVKTRLGKTWIEFLICTAFSKATLIEVPSGSDLWSDRARRKLLWSEHPRPKCPLIRLNCARNTVCDLTVSDQTFPDGKDLWSDHNQTILQTIVRSKSLLIRLLCARNHLIEQILLKHIHFIQNDVCIINFI